MKRIISIILTFCIICLTLSGCGESSSLIRYDISSPATNLDPQFASSETDQMIIHNLFEGLVRQLPNGEIEKALAESWTISEDKLTYTFYLREDAKWRTGSPVIADDFVFAFQRMFNSLSPSQYSQYYLSLQYAEEILNDKVSPSLLGVKALDTYTVEFKLKQPDSSFLEKLCHSSAMPCSRTFFEETRGKYGTTKNSVASCGPFFLNLWDNEKLYIKKNTLYYDEYSVKTPGVYLWINRANSKTEEENVSLYDLVLQGKSDSSPVTFEQAEEAKELGYSCLEHIGTVWGLVANPKHSQLSNDNIRRSFFHSINREELDGYLSENMVLCDRIIAPEISLNSEFYTETTQITPNLYAPELARSERADGLAEIGHLSLNGMELLVPKDAEIPYFSGMLQQMWQRNLSAFVNIVAVEKEELLRRVENGDYDLAIVPFTASSNSPYDVLSRFMSEAVANKWNYSNPIYDSFLENASSTENKKISANLYSEAESLLYEDCVVFPLFSEVSYIIFAPNVSGIEIYPYGGMVRFKDAVAMR